MASQRELDSRPCGLEARRSIQLSYGPCAGDKSLSYPAMEPSLPPDARAILDLTIRVRMAAKAILRAADACAAHEGISHPEMTLLACLRDFGDELTIPEVARIRRMKRQSIQTTVGHLLERGLVELLKNPQHRRSKLVRPTKAGLVVREAIDNVAAESMLRVAERFKRRDLERATRVLEDLVKRIDEVHPA